MKVKNVDYFKMVIYLILGILFVISSYTIIINIRHYKSLSSTIVVSEADNDYSEYKKNINLIEEVIDNYANKDNLVYINLTKALDSMKKDGVFRLIPKSKLQYQNLYLLNDYFMEELINNIWVKNFEIMENSKKYQNIISLLANNSKYLNSVFTSNSLTLYDSKLDNKIDDNYHFILNNYLMYSNVILDISQELGGSYE